MLTPAKEYRDFSLDELAPRVRVGDRTAFKEIFVRLSIPLGRYASRLAGEPRAADAVQDVFLKLWEIRKTIVVHTSLQAMLYTMVRNRCLNVRRDADRRLFEPLEDMASTSDPSPEEIAAGADLGDHIERWIGELPPRRAEAFILSRYDGLAHKDIAQVMGISKRTVDTHILHALRYLRDRLEACERQTMPS